MSVVLTQEQLIAIEAEKDEELRHLSEVIFGGREDELGCFLDKMRFESREKRSDLLCFMERTFSFGMPIVSLDLMRPWIEREGVDIDVGFQRAAINNHAETIRHMLKSPSVEMIENMEYTLNECIDFEAYEAIDAILERPNLPKSYLLEAFEDAICDSDTRLMYIFLKNQVHFLYDTADDCYTIFYEYLKSVEQKHARSTPLVPELNARESKVEEGLIRHFLKDVRLRTFCKCALYDSNGHLPPNCAIAILDHTTIFCEMDNVYVLDRFIRVRNNATCDALCSDSRVYSTFSWQYLTPFPNISMFRRRLLDVCIGLQSLRLPAWQTFRIIKWLIPHSVPRHIMWKFITTVKHFAPEKN
jgi:hypothetical protein